MIGNQDSNAHLKYFTKTTTTQLVQHGLRQQQEKLQGNKLKSI